MSQLTSISLATFNRLDLTQKMISSFFENTNSPYILNIIDNGSTDGTQEWLRTNIKKNQYCQNFNLIFNEENKGIAYARNQGLKIGATYNPDFYCTLDNDVIVPNNWLNEIIDVINANPNYCMGLNYEGVEYPLFISNGFSFQLKSQGNLGTATAVFTKELVDKIGGFKKYLLYGEEDANFFFRARVAGYGMGYLKNAVHLGEGENDVGEYREWKTACHISNYHEFVKDCHDYMSASQSIFINFKED